MPLPPKNDVNYVTLEGVIYGEPAAKEEGHAQPVTYATLLSTEVWPIRGGEGGVRIRENKIGLKAHGKNGVTLASLQSGAHIIVHGNLETAEVPGPRGGITTKTKIRITRISYPL